MKILRKFLTMLLAMIVCVLPLSACKGNSDDPDKDSTDEYKKIEVADTDRVITMENYLNLTKGAMAAGMVGVSFGNPFEFKHEGYKYPTAPWRPETITKAYFEDDMYLSLGALEVLDKRGLDVSSRQAAIDLYNKNYEFWDGSNNDVLIAGWAPPFSGYPKRGIYTTQPWPDSCSYMCGGSFAGLIAPGAIKSSNENADKFAQIVCYGDGIYGTQFVSALYAEAYFEKDIMNVVNAALKALPDNSWTKLCVEDVIANFNAGMDVESNCWAIYEKWVDDPFYNWTVWPNGIYPGEGILLDAKACAAFITIGLLYGEGDIEKSMRYTIACGGDTDSNAVHTIGVLSMINGGYDKLETRFISQLKNDLMFKYTPYKFDDTITTFRRVMEKNIIVGGGKVGYVDDVLSIAIPQNLHTVKPVKYQNSKTPEPMEAQVFSDEEMAQMRIIKDPGFEMQTAGSIKNAWASTTPSKLAMETYSLNAYEGLNNAKITNNQNTFADIYKRADVEKGKDYSYTVYIKTNGNFAEDSIKMTVETPNGESVVKTQSYGASPEWTKLTMNFNTGNNSGIRIRIGFNGGSSQILYLDNFGLIKA